MPKLMRAAIYEGGRLRTKEINVPKITSEQALLRVKITGFCGTDSKKMHDNVLRLHRKDPRIFGHEIVGEISECGGSVDTLRVGERVAVFHHVPCLETHCQPCNDEQYAQCPTYKTVDTFAGYGKPSGGGFAEYIVLPKEVIQRGLVKIPPEIGYEEAVFIEPLNCVLKALKLFEKSNLPISNNEPIVVIGQGANGLLFTQILQRIYGANVISIESNAFRRKKSAEFGATALKPNETGKLRTLRVKKAIVACASEEAIRSAIDIVEEGGAIVYFGDLIPKLSGSVDWNEFSRNERPIIINGRHIIPSYSSAYELHEEAATLAFSGKLDLRTLITHKFGLDELNAAVKGFVTGKLYSDKVYDVLKILIQPNLTSGLRCMSPWEYYMGQSALTAVYAAVLPLLVASGVALYLQHERLLENGCKDIPNSCNYVCDKDVGEIPQTFKVEKEGKIYYLDYVCGSPP